MAIFIKLFATKIVAKSFLGFSKSLDIISIGFEFSSELVSKSVWVNENKATSAPDINAEQSSSKKNNTIPDTIEVSNVVRDIVKLMGSGSKFKSFGLY